ncbi:hypothetical protein SCT_0805 [Sulfuricella sp. T08]|uniref:FecR family protein n=1 Tax=Sulfuricella sp. T08 TaxID=1632857 RepID=UPI000617988F|nr:FecR family protein [Sulfuricella sp. T08]GAO35419.1 hypothetical protein SCT_0805 [Sulfuricella sp. T08]
MMVIGSGIIRHGHHIGKALLLLILALTAAVAAASTIVGEAKNAIGTLLVTRSDGIEERLRGKGALALYEGDVLSTGPDSRALIQFRDGVRVALDYRTRFMILSRWEKDKASTRILRLDKGALWVKTRSGSGALEVETPVASAAVSDAEFIIEVLDGGNSILSVIKGVVPFGTAFGTCPIRTDTVSYAVQGKKCTKPETMDVRPAAAWKASLDDSPSDSAAGSKPDAAPLPPFWPPPDASTHQTIPRELVVGNAPATSTLASVAARMERAIGSAGYSSPGYYSVPGGFAMLTQLERINPDATPLPAEQRWKIKVSPVSLTSFNLAAYLKALLGKDAGLFRVIAFVFTAEPIVASGVKPLMDEAKLWVGHGGTALPAKFSALPYSSDMICTALVYEFEIPSHGAAAHQLKPSDHNGQQHLKAARILQALGG